MHSTSSSPTGGSGTKRVKIDWKGARFDFKEKDFPLEMKSSIISSGETVLTMKWHHHKINDAFSVTIGSATINVTAAGAITTTAAGVVVEVQKDASTGHGEVDLTLPFALTGSTSFTFGGALSSHAAVNVATHMKTSVGRFSIEALFDASAFPNGVDTTRSLDLQQKIGIQDYPGASVLSATQLEIHGKDKWQDVN